LGRAGTSTRRRRCGRIGRGSQRPGDRGPSRRPRPAGGRAGRRGSVPHARRDGSGETWRFRHEAHRGPWSSPPGWKDSLVLRSPGGPTTVAPGTLVGGGQRSPPWSMEPGTESPPGGRPFGHPRRRPERPGMGGGPAATTPRRPRTAPGDQVQPGIRRPALLQPVGSCPARWPVDRPVSGLQRQSGSRGSPGGGLTGSKSCVGGLGRQPDRDWP